MATYKGQSVTVNKSQSHAQQVASAAKQMSSVDASSPVSSKVTASAPAYNSKTGKATGTPSPEYDSYLKSLNKKGSSNYIPTPDDAGMENMDTVPGQNPIAPVPGQAPAPQPAPIQAPPGGTPIAPTPTQNKYQTGAVNAVASGAPVPDSAGQARSQTGGFTPNAEPDFSVVDTALQADKGYQELIKQEQEYKKLENQQTSLSEEYAKLTKQAGIPALNTELINMKNVIEGTEEDIRNEVQATSGFATESQVLALASSRNKTLIKNYNTLLDAKSSQMEYINTMMGMKKDDRNLAQQSLQNRLQFKQMENQFRDKFVNNAKEAYQNNIKALGYDGLYNSIAQDPKALSLAEKVLGLAPGGMATAAQQASQLRVQQQKVKGSSSVGGGSKSSSSITQAVISDPSLFDDLTPTVKGQVISELQSQGYNTSNLGVKGLSDAGITQVAQTQKALDDLDVLKGKIGGNEEFIGPLKGLQKLNPWSKSRQIQADVNRVRQTVGKALEGGVLRKEDEDKYKQILATLVDTPETAIYKIDALKSSITRDIETYKSLQQSSGRSLDTKAPLTKKGTETKPEELRSKYGY